VRRIIFLGQRQIAWKALEVLARPENCEALTLAVLVTDADTFTRVDQELSGLSPRFVPNDKRRTEQIISAIHEEGADLLISVQHNWILSKEVLKAVDGWAFNLHNARLPHYKGYNSISHAILNGDESYYSTIHWMEEEVDSGAIAFEVLTPIRRDDTALSLHRKTIDRAVGAFEQLIGALRDGAVIPRHPTTEVTSQFYGRKSLKDIMDVTAERDPEQLDRLARALFYPPHNMAYQMAGERKTYLVPRSGLQDLCVTGFPLDQ
jgi:methionyl-tRNA formyltransferase